MNINPIPIIAIDGTSSSGKGTLAYLLAQHFNFNYLNSGALYRLTAYVALKKNINLSDEEALIEVARELKPEFKDKQVLFEGEDIWPIICTQEYGNYASEISPNKGLREALFDVQRNMITSPGLVAEGRDMCTHVFTDAQVKIYLDADVNVRASRRLNDENAKGTGKTLESIVNELKIRDDRDMNRDLGRLYPASDAFIFDTGHMTIQENLNECIKWCESKGLK